jgi:hypothetical protein
MTGTIFSRDPRNPREVYGPFAVDQLPEFVKQGRVRATDQVSFDEQTWMPATELEPRLFPGATPSRDRYAGLPPWQQTAFQAGDWLKAAAIVVWNYIKAASIVIWNYLKATGEFYWSHRGELRQMAVEIIPILKDPGARRELHLNADETSDAYSFENNQWKVALPDCCVVCGEPADGEWNKEQRSLTDLTWPFYLPLLGLLFGIVAWIFTWSSDGKWFVPLGVFAGFLIGYKLRRDTVVTVQFRRCREHLNRTKIPSLRVFRKKLIVGIGDRKVWRLFYHGDRGLETPIAAPPDFHEIVDGRRAERESQNSSPYPTTIPLVDDSELESNRDSSHPET